VQPGRCNSGNPRRKHSCPGWWTSYVAIERCLRRKRQYLVQTRMTATRRLTRDAVLGWSPIAPAMDAANVRAAQPMLIKATPSSQPYLIGAESFFAENSMCKPCKPCCVTPLEAKHGRFASCRSLEHSGRTRAGLKRPGEAQCPTFLTLLSLRVIDEVWGPTLLRERIPTHEVAEHERAEHVGS